ncbi:MAG: two-component sensor histidine kinase [Bacteroidales bacterium 36-12]|nr:MAG: two-component sensor histidine kinase [Bacteroidales bacterium 36-12]
MKLTYRQRMFLYFAVLFTCFTMGIIVFERSRETTFKTEALEGKLDVYAELIQNSLTDDVSSYKENLSLISSVVSNLRISVIDLQGNVLYDNIVDSYSTMENHLNREEIKIAQLKGNGSYIRKSETNNQPYLYYAKKFIDRYIRVALPHTVQLRHFLQADNMFLYFLLVLFVVFLFVIHKITAQFGASINKLRNFALQSHEVSPTSIQFTEDELGEIGRKIIENYRLLEENRKNIFLERQKLLQHIQISEEGICFISSLNEIEFYNGLFIQYINQITDNPVSNPNVILLDDVFVDLHKFIISREVNYFESKIEKHGKVFSLKATIFDDNSFEVILTDITQQEKMQQLKQEMTGNIAHELRTPITSIRAYLETVLDQNIPEDRKQYFTLQAYNQTITLSELIKDMSLIAEIEEAPNTFELEEINFVELLEKLKDEVHGGLIKKNIKISWSIPDNLTIKGNSGLINAIFRNLIENVVRHAGENIEINISAFNEDNEYHYFSFYDTGVGIGDEKHLQRLFERFYRVHEGRARDTGGSGLGLSIVKNAVLFHKGRISAKNRKEGGLEFIFQLHK